ncbi:UDP-N-acetylmuramoyl-L-alanyl-D-glutamate--2,6-diaminopimelate ligase [Luteimonas wenzhouensis]|jgi:UDP-N-acetylmuramoyl-L-alanyl-D-glutamate--2,6-diaminopimelate ligase|uniref:UDP-N-acetylmuramoyl-L-alanyl-D-glutamate--2,6-diaminopimelate ligase n=1 Tax=Luteimonas wenzhouensis TaxID=2599615 RepID=A0A5C5U807_9GAMM|nr:UDP-N-acetylmuramoyl-L-alanyl-D-glutamate--2,6-diaminopimelate ligase [Luteimonas wenzhouensis]NLW95458.1 UDP-N-acetylmuramoyl-L-alanyl-D-glutamate--2,6-diaminopimelate ligase [Xanthomonadaceae bacterium]TWT22068.1 UDP-N-acetylmuramoyl-L-alanyl-D-glutamate--2,6-diaminopimelate ligase [Luteimonas wenzhouensis]
MSRTVPLAQLLPDVPGIPDVAVAGLALDSRELRPGDAFVAVAGFGRHGLHFAADAARAGARAILFEPPVPGDVPPPPPGAIAVPGLRARLGELADAFHERPSARMTTIGVTGTSGKTSTVQLLAQALELNGVRAGTIGTLGAGPYGRPRPTGFTTPLVLTTHALLAGLRDEGMDAVAMEVSSHALDQGRVDGVHFAVAVFTNLSRDHLDYHPDMAHYGATKARLFAMPGLRAAVVNLDDPFGRGLLPTLPATLEVLGTSARGAADAAVRATDVVLDGNGLSFLLHMAGRSWPVASPLLGRFNIDNLLVVAAVMRSLGHDPDSIAATLGRLQPIPGRMNRIGGGDRPLVVVDYSHKPDPLEQALQSLRDHLRGRLVCVFGCGGERDAGKRPVMAAIAERLADEVVVTDDNPRHEDGDAIVAGIMAGFAHPERVRIERDRRAAITGAITRARAGDIVLVAGKGHEDYQEVAGVKHPFDDVRVARQALHALAAGEVAR